MRFYTPKIFKKKPKLINLLVKMVREREKLKEILMYYLKNPEDLDKIEIVEENGEYWIEWGE